MKFTAKITLNGGHHVLTPDAIAELVGQRPIVRCGPSPARGTVTAAEMDEEGRVFTTKGHVLTLTIDVPPGAVAHASMDASMGYILYAGETEQARTVDLLEITPAPAEPCEPERYTFVDYLRVAYADPGSVVGARVGGEQREPIGHWAARAAIVVVDERDRLTHILTCSQCGRGLFHRACGPTHALMARDPWRHRAAPKPKWDPST